MFSFYFPSMSAKLTSFSNWCFREILGDQNHLFHFSKANSSICKLNASITKNQYLKVGKGMLLPDSAS